MNKKIKPFLLVVLLVFVMGEIGFLVFGDRLKLNSVVVKPSSEAILEQYANNVVGLCKKEQYPPACYDREIPKLMNRITMEDAFAVTRIVQTKDGNFWYCHVLGHNISAQETKRDPFKWKDVIARVPTGMCSNGGVHGAFQERFRTDRLTELEIEKLKPDLSSICEPRDKWSPTSLQQATCYHALGHLLMYITSAKVENAANLCGQVVNQRGKYNFTQLCLDGVFMQIFQPLEPEDIALVASIAPKRDTAEAFCNQFADKKYNSCKTESWPLYFDEIMKPGGIKNFCSYADSRSEQTRCYNGVFYVIAAQFKVDEDKIGNFCASLEDDIRASCFSNGASRMLETDYKLIDQAVDLCRWAGGAGVGDQCLGELLFYSRYNFKRDSLEFLKLCNSLSENWKTRCLSKEDIMLKQS